MTEHARRAASRRRRRQDRQRWDKIAKSLCYECGDDAKENDGLQQVVRSALADVD